MFETALQWAEGYVLNLIKLTHSETTDHLAKQSFLFSSMHTKAGSFDHV